jgi:hypothetical protein
VAGETTSGRPKTANDRALEKIRADQAAARAKLLVPAGKTSKELDEYIAAHHAAVRAKNEKAPPPTDAELAQLAKDRADSVSDVEQTSDASSLAAKLPRAAKAATGEPGGVVRGRMQTVDVQRFEPRKFPVLPWVLWVEELAHTFHRKGDPSVKLICRVAEKIGWSARDTEMIQRTYEQLTKIMHCCVTSVFVTVKWIEAHGALDVINSLHREENNDYHRGANVYLPVMPPADASAPEAAPVLTELAVPEAAPVLTELAVPEATPDSAAVHLAALARVEATLNRWAARFGLVSRAWGLNATPIASLHRRARRHAHPA